ncbi:uncharacterized protein LOC129587945 [Paramacrobiotus metropolitanus]|uniref:uncharacterized protein LOC129587945 n=1 Tax=Paramacrobiotus metropolitanus TaxID=2943436 RepID=UPI0024456646|nr:uncharacterized protein LOC129587945 [Paramacrobiotus metropolitanus]
MDLPESLPLPRYQPLLVEASQMSYQNTVAVKNADDTWWLGYIQDINGDQAFIHFASTTVAPRWIHMENIWPLPFYLEPGGPYPDQHQKLYVALRDEDDGPFRFRPARWLRCLHGCEGSCGMFYVTTQRRGSIDNAHAPSTCFEMVDRGQVAGVWPPPGPPLSERQNALLYTKHCIPFPEAEKVLRDAADPSRMIKHLRDAVETFPFNRCRFHLRVQKDGCTFVLAGSARDAETAQMTEATLVTVLQKHVTSRANLPPIRDRNVFVAPGLESDALMVPARIRELTPWLLSDILSYLDIHSQMRAKGVCALWQHLLNSAHMTEHVSISFESCYQLKSDSGNCLKAATLLNRYITSHTKSLTVLRYLPVHNVTFLWYWLEGMQQKYQMQLPFLVFKDMVRTAPGYMQWYVERPLKHPAALDALNYKDLCHTLVLCNWTVGALFGRTAYDVFERNPHCPPHQRLRVRERERMLQLTLEAHTLDIDKLQISIPRLLVRCSERRTHATPRVMQALSDYCPPVTEEMLAKVTAVHARWVRTLAYPEEWQAIRQYLVVFSGFHADGTLHMWDTVDLRLMCPH